MKGCNKGSPSDTVLDFTPRITFLRNLLHSSESCAVPCFSWPACRTSPLWTVFPVKRRFFNLPDPATYLVSDDFLGLLFRVKYSLKSKFYFTWRFKPFYNIFNSSAQPQ
uniref:Uncharacterized protein n=1 Tax=Cacopsylla melanoneura TaxID=428564 RepID=A0A8D8ZBD9_9HEMI